jgi:hypothetical protein
LDAFLKQMLALGYLYVTFPLKVRSHLARSELIHATKMKSNKCVISFHKPNYTNFHPRHTNVDVIFNFVLLPIIEK